MASSELSLMVTALLIFFFIGGIIPLIAGSVVSTETALTGIYAYTYDIFGSGVDLTGSYDSPQDEGILLNYMQGVQLMSNEFPIIFYSGMFIFALIMVYGIVKALPFT